MHGTPKLLYVYPYMIMPDPLATQEYLVCYVKNENSTTGKHIASFSMARLQLQGSAMKQTFHLTKDDKIAIEKSLMTARRHIYLAQIKELSSN